MPEAAVDEDSKSELREDDVGADQSTSCPNAVVLSKPQAAAVKC
jgi:hypothetical protein